MSAQILVFRDIYWVRIKKSFWEKRNQPITWQTYPDLIRYCHLWFLNWRICTMSKSTSALVCVPWDMFTLIKSNYLLILSCFFLILMADMVGGSFQSISHGVYCRTNQIKIERKFKSVNHSPFAALSFKVKSIICWFVSVGMNLKKK